ncbi:MULTISPECIES: helix-turn-helix transcriptional regulator [unclassified Pseudofrankia]|uniref:helix-turn-helix domain-containing protein n=1 Tax=unclassified Pseudofrankia TaxID=2994372 RepID=UPI0008DA193F|nr:MULTISPECIES: helix-turn-helix transcriptional regulator [unclassified Pseudofrankia]MDT3440848.1 helix-turn-helix transcriptional regulator [Pseudofrankia sp. BMG5.37]OHV43692.1 hypothetical protein BCD48_27345 [Pseudofrankia sp. BMG5.36]
MEQDEAPELPDEFWHTDQLRDAFAAQHIGLVSVAYRMNPHHRRLISQERLGRWLGLTQAQVSRIESGPPVRDLDRLTHWARMLRLPPHLLWFDLPGQPRLRPAPVATRREVPSRVEPSTSVFASGGTLETIRSAALAFRSADRQLGGGRLYPVVVRFIQTEVAPQLVGHAYPPSAVFSAAASLADMAGWLAHDDNRGDLAAQHFVQALGLATAAGDQALSAQTLVSQSHLALENDHPREAVRLADAGLALVPDDQQCGELRSRLHAMKARGNALVGASSECLAALWNAEQELNRATAGGHEWLSPFDEAALAAEAAICLRDLNDWNAAERQALRVLELRTPDRARSRALTHLTLATVHLGRGDLDAACDTGAQVLDAATRLASDRVVNQLRGLGRQLEPHSSVTAVDDFLDRVTATLPAHRAAEAS